MWFVVDAMEGAEVSTLNFLMFGAKMECVFEMLLQQRGKQKVLPIIISMLQDKYKEIGRLISEMVAW